KVYPLIRSASGTLNQLSNSPNSRCPVRASRNPMVRSIEVLPVMTSGGVIGAHASASQEALTGSSAASRPVIWYCSPPRPSFNSGNGANKFVTNATCVGSPGSIPQTFVALGTHQFPPKNSEPATELRAWTSLYG